MKKKRLFILISLFLACLGCPPEVKIIKEKPEPAVPVKVQQVSLKDLDEIIDYVGNINAQDEVMVYPKVTGKISAKIKEEGQPVAKGEIIAYIDRDEVGLKFEPAPIESPLGGVVGRVYVDIGANVHTQTAVCLVVNMDKVNISLDVPEKYLPRIFLGQQARITVDAYPQEEFTGQISKISPVVDLATRSAPLEISLDNAEHRLKSGMYCRVKLVIQERKGVPVIFKEAVMGKGADTYVYVVEDKKAVLKKVRLGIRQGPYFEVLEGLTESEAVVIVGQQKLNDGVEVEAEE